MRCAKCGKNCTDDWFSMSFERVKDGQLYVPNNNRVILCKDCYGKLVDIFDNHVEEPEEE